MRTGRIGMLALGVAVAAMSGCSGGGTGTVVFVGADTPPTGAPVSAVAPGVGTNLSPSGTPGYAITTSDFFTYRLVWTGDFAGQNFQGSIYTTNGFVEIVPSCGGGCRLESDDFIADPIAIDGGYRIDFDAVTGGDIDGFDFTAANEPVYFDLLIDGRRVPELVTFTGADGFVVSAPSMPFGLVGDYGPM